MVVLDLLQKDKLGIVVEVMAVSGEMLVKGKPGGFLGIIPVGIEALVRRWFRFSYILLIWAFGAIPKIEAVWAAAVEVVFYAEGFTGDVACEGFGCRYLSAAFVFRIG